MKSENQAQISNHPGYIRKITVTAHQGNPFTVTSLVPKLPKQERENRMKEAKSGLSEIFGKYHGANHVS